MCCRIIKIDNLNREELSPYVAKSEAELLHYYEPAEGIFIAETANVIIRALDAGYEIESLLVEEERLEIEAPAVWAKIEELYGKEKLAGLPIFVAPHEVINKMTGYNLVRGLCAVMRRKPLQSVSDFLEGKNRIVILYDVVNPTNVGAIIRSAAALGMDGVMLTKSSVNPLARRASRVSMGTVFQIPWTVAQGNDEMDIDKVLHKDGFKTIAMALTNNSITPDNEALKREEKLAIYMGTEGEGLPKDLIEKSDYKVMIPMKHGVDSLNVSAAAAVIMWELS